MTDETCYIVRLRGFLRESDLERFKDEFEAKLDGKVIVVDERVESIAKLEPTDASELVELMYDFVRNRLGEDE